jgi:pimeloyl-ACP methyl ester carboxylesterase
MLKGHHPVTEPAVAPPDHLVKTPKGNVFVREIPGDDPPIVLMHGFPNDHNIYDRLLPLLSPIPAAAFDWRGYGRSERAQLGGFSLQEHASDLEALLDQLDMFDSLSEQGKLVDTGALRDLEVAVSIIFGGSDRYLGTLLAPEITGLVTGPSLHVVPDASHWPQHDRPRIVADLLAAIPSTQSQR